MNELAERWSYGWMWTRKWSSAFFAILRSLLVAGATVIAAEVLSGPLLYACTAILCGLVFGVPDYFNVRHTRSLLKLSLTDPLTGIGNRRALETRLEEESARCMREKRPLALLMIDVDKLKAINDSAGHRAGDEALRKVGRALRHSTRVSDVVGRLGGDEFLVIAPNTTQAAAVALGERIVSNTRKESGAGYGAGELGLSIGVAQATSDRDGLRGLLTAADKAMYEAKQAGGGKIVEAQPCVQAKICPIRPIVGR